jgi:hypothetical protein
MQGCTGANLPQQEFGIFRELVRGSRGCDDQGQLRAKRGEVVDGVRPQGTHLLCNLGFTPGFPRRKIGGSRTGSAEWKGIRHMLAPNGELTRIPVFPAARDAVSMSSDLI